MKKAPLLDVSLPGFSLFDRGKVRDIFEVGDNLLVVGTDRIFAYDRVYPGGVPGKGEIITALTVWAFKNCRGIRDNYVISSRIDDFPTPLRSHADLLRGRSLLVKKVTPIRLECVVRGFLYGQAWKAYQRGEIFWDDKLPAGLKQAQELPRPIFTPARKNRSGEDENINWPDLKLLLGEEEAEKLKNLSLRLYRRLREDWEKRGFLFADTKFEFGLIGARPVLINEASTPDCSRFWKIKNYRPGQIQDSWDKDILENYLRRKGYSPGSPPIPISGYIRRKMEERFHELLSAI